MSSPVPSVVNVPAVPDATGQSGPEHIDPAVSDPTVSDPADYKIADDCEPVLREINCKWGCEASQVVTQVSADH